MRTVGGSGGTMTLSDSEYMLSKIDGELVTAFNVSGTLMGADKAIYIAENAYVENINILSGAYLQGDIVSDWNPGNALLRTDLQNTLFTTLTFGNTLSEDGTLVGDSNFSLVYSGNIDGPMSIDMELDAGTLTLGGHVDVHSLRVATNATLALKGTSDSSVHTTGDVIFADNSGNSGKIIRVAIPILSIKLSSYWEMRPPLKGAKISGPTQGVPS